MIPFIRMSCLSQFGFVFVSTCVKLFTFSVFWFLAVFDTAWCRCGPWVYLSGRCSLEEVSVSHILFLPLTSPFSFHISYLLDPSSFISHHHSSFFQTLSNTIGLTSRFFFLPCFRNAVCRERVPHCVWQRGESLVCWTHCVQRLVHFVFRCEEHLRDRDRDKEMGKRATYRETDTDLLFGVCTS